MEPLFAMPDVPSPHDAVVAAVVDHPHIANDLAQNAVNCLILEVDTYPKPGLVSHIDTGAHTDMNCHLLYRSASTLAPAFEQLGMAGMRNEPMHSLRRIGLAAEHAMLHATGGINTHRGALFGLGLLVAAAGYRSHHVSALSLGEIVKTHWGQDILATLGNSRTHGGQMRQKYGAGGAAAQAVAGFPSLYHTGLPALRQGRVLSNGNEHAARVHACFALIATLCDTNVLYRTGQEGLAYAQSMAQSFLDNGGVGAADWYRCAESIHQAFIHRNISPGGAADLLAMTLFVDAQDRRDPCS